MGRYTRLAFGAALAGLKSNTAGERQKEGRQYHPVLPISAYEIEKYF